MKKTKTIKTLIVIVGPTAVGKTALAIKIAQNFNTEILSADSRQFFIEMNIGTAKPTAAELAAIPHHYINSHSIKDFFSTGDFEVAAIKTLDTLFKSHNEVVMVGGSGLYIDAVCKGLDTIPEIDLAVRAQLNQLYAQEGIEPIQQQLQAVDPVYFDKVDQQNPQRMIRGLEVYLSTGARLSSFLAAQIKQRPFNILKIGLNDERSVIYNRINNRVDNMIRAGLLEEVKGLMEYKTLNALKTVGYTELFQYLEGGIDLEAAIDRIKQNTRRFAKRQLTWFHKDTDTQWFKPDDAASVIAHIRNRLNS